jgi:hypothetical protein
MEKLISNDNIAIVAMGCFCLYLIAENRYYKNIIFNRLKSLEEKEH